MLSKKMVKGLRRLKKGEDAGPPYGMVSAGLFSPDIRNGLVGRGFARECGKPEIRGDCNYDIHHTSFIRITPAGLKALEDEV